MKGKGAIMEKANEMILEMESSIGDIQLYVFLLCLIESVDQVSGLTLENGLPDETWRKLVGYLFELKGRDEVIGIARYRMIDYLSQAVDELSMDYHNVMKQMSSCIPDYEVQAV